MSERNWCSYCRSPTHNDAECWSTRPANWKPNAAGQEQVSAVQSSIPGVAPALAAPLPLTREQIEYLEPEEYRIEQGGEEYIPASTLQKLCDMALLAHDQRAEIEALQRRVAFFEADRCEFCGATINKKGCGLCGAPQCCPQCCVIDALKRRVAELEADLAEWKRPVEMDGLIEAQECGLATLVLDEFSARKLAAQLRAANDQLAKEEK